jgi:hypothetical protein
MKTKQENFLTMAHAVNKVVQKNQTKWAAVKRFAQAATELNDLVNITSTANAKADSKNTGTTKDKHSAGFEAIDEGVKIGKRASVYALDKNNMDLHDRLRFSRSSLLSRHDTEGLAKLKEVYELLNPIVAELGDFGILPADMQHYKKLIDNYDNLLTKPRELIAARKTLNGTVLPEFVNKMRKVLYHLDSMINLFETTPFYKDYINARKVIELGTRSEKPKDDPKDDTGEVDIPPAKPEA